MAEIVIKIPEKVRVVITRMGLLRIPDEMLKEVDRAIQRGTPLPKGHGKLIDADFECMEAVLADDTESRYTHECSKVVFGIDKLPSVRPQEQIPEQWQELKETIIELRDNDGTGTQQQVCRFLADLMVVLEEQMVEPQESEEKE